MVPSTRSTTLQVSHRSGRSDLHPQVCFGANFIIDPQRRWLTDSLTWCRWECLKESVYSLTIEYEAGGVGKPLLENMIVRLDFPPRDLGCHIYSIPLDSKPVGATHRLRIWLRSPSPFNSEGDSFRTYTYQRVWSTDEFRIGGFLDFMDIDQKRVILAAPLERPALRIHTAESFRFGRGSYDR